MAEGYKEDVVPISVTEPSAENKFDGVSNPDKGTVTQLSPTFGENDFPRQTGSDSLSSEEALLA